MNIQVIVVNAIWKDDGDRNTTSIFSMDAAEEAKECFRDLCPEPYDEVVLRKKRDGVDFFLDDCLDLTIYLDHIIQKDIEDE